MYLNKKILIALILMIVGSVISVSVFFMLNKRINIESAKESVMLIYAYDEYGELISSGSGFIAFENDVLITNAHVVEDAYKIEVISEKNNKYNVLGLIGYDSKKDIAIFKLENYKKLKDFPVFKKIKVGEEVYAIGSPLGIKNTVSNGILSGIREEDGFEIYQYTAPISPGSSGGALLNKKGEVVGITYASIIDGQNLNLAIQISDVEKEYNKASDKTPIDLKYKKLINSRIFASEKGKKIFNAFDSYSFEDTEINKWPFLTFTVEKVAHLSGNSGDGEYEKKYVSPEKLCEWGNFTSGCILGAPEVQINENYSEINIAVFKKNDITLTQAELMSKENSKYDSINEIKFKVYEDEQYYYLLSFQNISIKGIAEIFKE